MPDVEETPEQRQRRIDRAAHTALAPAETIHAFAYGKKPFPSDEERAKNPQLDACAAIAETLALSLEENIHNAIVYRARKHAETLVGKLSRLPEPIDNAG